MQIVARNTDSLTNQLAVEMGHIHGDIAELETKQSLMNERMVQLSFDRDTYLNEVIEQIDRVDHTISGLKEEIFDMSASLRMSTKLQALEDARGSSIIATTKPYRRKPKHR